MQPNDPFQPAPSDIDYLNQIAPPPPPAKMDKKFLVIIGLLAIVGISSLAFIANMASKSNDNTPAVLKLVARLQKIQNISNKYKSKLKSSAIQDTNSSLSAILTTANKAISDPVASYAIDMKKQGKDLAALDPSAELEKRLDEAYLNSVLDDVYVREINFQLEETIIMMKRMLQEAKTTSMKEYLTTTIPNFENLQKSFARIIAPQGAETSS